MSIFKPFFSLLFFFIQQQFFLNKFVYSASSQLLCQLDALITSGPLGQQRRRMEGNEKKKKKRMKADPDVPRLSLSLRNHLDHLANLKGKQVAARVTQEDDDKDEWFIVKVIHFDRETLELEVLDEEPGDDEPAGKRYMLFMNLCPKLGLALVGEIDNLCKSLS
ncbi:putative SGF29 tudor-like domain, SAGA-associated factor 29 [Helianthus debilis subsp. tardiflorus]